MKLTTILLMIQILLVFSSEPDCQTCIATLHTLKKAKSSSVCDAESQTDFSCFKLYYYLFYFSPNYFFSSVDNPQYDCEVCSYVEKCGISECYKMLTAKSNETVFLEESLTQSDNTNLVHSTVQLIIDKFNKLLQLIDKASLIGNTAYKAKKEYIKNFLIIKTSSKLNNHFLIKNEERSFTLKNNNDADSIRLDLKKAIEYLKKEKLVKSSVSTLRSITAKAFQFVAGIIEFSAIPFEIVEVEKEEKKEENSLIVELMKKLDEIQQRQIAMEANVKKEIEDIRNGQSKNHVEPFLPKETIVVKDNVRTSEGEAKLIEKQEKIEKIQQTMQAKVENVPEIPKFEKLLEIPKVEKLLEIPKVEKLLETPKAEKVVKIPNVPKIKIDSEENKETKEVLNYKSNVPLKPNIFLGSTEPNSSEVKITESNKLSEDSSFKKEQEIINRNKSNAAFLPSEELGLEPKLSEHERVAKKHYHNHHEHRHHDNIISEEAHRDLREVRRKADKMEHQVRKSMREEKEFPRIEKKTIRELNEWQKTISEAERLLMANYHYK